jgi:tRNA threonylcarbamoyl adenosine modification protein (Sua5/YciO/YrdC/YwlC family)
MDENITTPITNTQLEADSVVMPHSEGSVIVDPTDDEVMVKAGEIIRNGGLVSFPTETVYGLGANALDVDAATSIFTTKERPMTDPLIVHVYEKKDAYELIDEDEEIKEVFDILADKFWPGPFTCVMKANTDKISPVITAGTGYVGIRCPNHPVALKLIKEAQRPIAAPSANKFGHVSPTKADHVMYDFKNDSVYILDGGSSNFGIESTVVKIARETQDIEDPEEYHIKLWILRRGGISEKEFALAISECHTQNKKIKLSVECVKKKHFTEESHKMEAPGQFLRHYAPNLPSYMLSDDQLGEEDSLPLNLAG